MNKKQRVPITMPFEAFLRLKQEADLAEQSMNKYICGILSKRKVVIIPQIRQLYTEVYRIRIELERLQDVSNKDGVSKLVERVDKLCRFCDTSLANMIISIN